MPLVVRFQEVVFLQNLVLRVCSGHGLPRGRVVCPFGVTSIVGKPGFRPDNGPSVSGDAYWHASRRLVASHWLDVVSPQQVSVEQLRRVSPRSPRAPRPQPPTSPSRPLGKAFITQLRAGWGWWRLGLRWGGPFGAEFLAALVTKPHLVIARRLPL